jgi:hypothetical protein
MGNGPTALATAIQSNVIIEQRITPAYRSKVIDCHFCVKTCQELLDRAFRRVGQFGDTSEHSPDFVDDFADPAILEDGQEVNRAECSVSQLPTASDEDAV